MKRGDIFLPTVGEGVTIERVLLSIIGRVAAGWLAVLILVSGSSVLSSRILAERSLAARPIKKDALLRGNLLAEISRRPSLAFGFRNFLGDLVWLNAVQVSSPLRMSFEDYDELFLLLDTVINFDPRFKVPYLLGALILGDSPSHARDALITLNRGRKNHQADWRFPFYIGYIQYFSLGDPIEGGKALFEAARLPESPPHLPSLAARMISEGREPETALAFLTAMMNQESNPGRREAFRKRIQDVIVERDIQALERAVAAYRNRTGENPERITDLIGAGLIVAVPKEPHGGRYILMPDGTIRSDRAVARFKVFRRK